ncbi:hypothetical protein EJB05_24858, partial [Eragrostis curvula]
MTLYEGAMSLEKQKPVVDDKTLLKQPAIPPVPERPSLLTIVSFAFLTFNSAMAVLGSHPFACFSFLTIVLLFRCLRWYEAAALGSPRREHLKMAVWLLTTMLTIAFFMLLEFWFSSAGHIAAKGGTAPDQLTAGAPKSFIGSP